MSKEFSTRPSDMLGITGEARRFMFDNAVFAFGKALSNELASVEGKNSKDVQRKSQKILDRWLQGDGPRRYRDPARRKVK